MKLSIYFPISLQKPTLYFILETKDTSLTYLLHSSYLSLHRVSFYGMMYVQSLEPKYGILTFIFSLSLPGFQNGRVEADKEADRIFKLSHSSYPNSLTVV